MLLLNVMLRSVDSGFFFSQLFSLVKINTSVGHRISCGIRLLGEQNKWLLRKYTVGLEATGSGMDKGTHLSAERKNLYKAMSEKRM